MRHTLIPKTNTLKRTSSRYHFRYFVGKVSQQTVRIPRGYKLRPSSNRHLPILKRSGSYTDSDFNGKETASLFNFTYRYKMYIDDALSINNPDFENYRGQMYLVELETKDTTESTTSAHFLQLLLSIGRDAYIFDKRDDFSFHTPNFRS